jgi:serine O-acetyltransferase
MMHLFRISCFLYQLRVPVLPWMLKIINRILFSVVLPPSVKVGRNVTFGYQGLGIVVHGHATFGDNIVISPNVVIGGRDGSGKVIIEDDVLIGAGACILGSVTIGKGAKVGANAVVLSDVPAGATVVGIPARVI